jgi:hypothetical protein
VIQDEADQLVEFVTTGGQDSVAKRAQLLAAREGLLDLAGKFTAEQIAKRVDAIDTELDNLDVLDSVQDVPRIDWEQPESIINEILRAMWSEIRLGKDLMPETDGFRWRRQEWRRSN